MPDKWTVLKAISMINRNGGHVGEKMIRHQNPGLKVLGAIDYLVNHHGYTWVR